MVILLGKVMVITIFHGECLKRMQMVGGVRYGDGDENLNGGRMRF